MKTKLHTLALVLGLLIPIPFFAQDKTTVSATNAEISDNLDLRAVASIFGEAKDLEDFERRLNDPRNKISNLDLNYDRQVDYLRVIEAVENGTHLIILQAVLEKDVFQDVATIEVERDGNNQVQVQVVGNVFMYGPNYIYEPVYMTRPIIYNYFWVHNYHPYHSPYYFNYYPTYYYAWTPYPVYRYRKNIHIHINHHNHYNYHPSRRSTNALAMYQTRRNNGYERKYPEQAFTTRNKVTNRYELANTRNTGTRATTQTRNTTVRSAANASTVRNNSQNVRTTGNNNIRSIENTNLVRNNSQNVKTTNDNNIRSAENTNFVRNNSQNVRTTSDNNIRSTENTNFGHYPKKCVS